MNKYLKFVNIAGKDRVDIWDNKEMYLGAIEKIRVGAWMSWCLTDINDVDVYFSASCLDEIREKIRELNSKR